MKVLRIIFAIVKKDTVLSVSFILALLSMFMIKPGLQYLSYIDFRTLAILLGMMIVMAGLERLGLFQQIGENLIHKVSNTKSLSFVVVGLCFISSMLITNDVALLTFVPFTVIILNMAGENKQLIGFVVLETVAANLGSMMMPMGNPQNLYLYSLSGMSLGEFVMITIPYAIVSLACIVLLLIILIKPVPIKLSGKHDFNRNRLQKTRLWSYIILFIVALLAVVRVLDYRIAFIAIIAVVMIIDGRILFAVDYSLIFTFVFLFIFIGNLKQIEIIRDTLSGFTENHEILISIVLSQAISNVPAAILLSGFTDNIRSLIIGTNIGGLGTLIASMASLISFKIYGTTINHNKKSYLITFSIINILLLLVLISFAWIIG